MERLSRKQKYQEYRDELKKDNEAFAKSQALNDYQNKINQLQNQFEESQNAEPIQKEAPSQFQTAPQETTFEKKPVEIHEEVKEEINPEDFSQEYKDLFDLLNETPVVEETSVEPAIVEPTPIVEEVQPVVEPVIEEPIIEEKVVVEPKVEEIKEEPVIEEPTIIDEPEVKEPIVIDTTQDYFEEESNSSISGIDYIVQGIDSYEEKPHVVHEEPNMAEFDNVKPIEPIHEEIKKEPVIEEPIIEEPVIEEPIIEEKVVVEPKVEEIKEEPVIEEPIKEVVQPKPVVEPITIKEEVPEVPVMEIEKETKKTEEPAPVTTTQEFEPVQEPDGIEIKNLDELVQEEEINATLTDTIPFVIDDEAVKEAIEEYDEEDEEEEEVPNKVLNVILIILIIVLVIVLGLIVYYILAGQGIIG